MVNVMLDTCSKPFWLQVITNSSPILLVCSVLLSALRIVTLWNSSGNEGGIKLHHNPTESPATRRDVFSAMLLSHVDDDLRSDGQSVDLTGFWVKVSQPLCAFLSRIAGQMVQNIFPAHRIRQLWSSAIPHHPIP